jgi:hypothetical protein
VCLAFEALIAFDFDAKSYVWIVTKDRAVWRQLAISADDVSKVVATLRSELDLGASVVLNRLACQLIEV